MDHGFLNYGTIPKAYRGWFFIFVLDFVSRDFEVGSKLESTVSPVWG